MARDGHDVEMVSANPGDSFGDDTAEYLGKLLREKGVLLAVCTSHYGEMTSSPYSSHEELKFAWAYKDEIKIIPLRVEQI